ncbi:MAG: TatD family hydrolase, partial [Candidatus Sabulitectum sp.]|nr:TatD family hydrolase [Candidatus Sabulitectum sp.]
DRFVLETDSPSMRMSGVPPGKSEPGHLAQVLRAVAEIRGENLSETQTSAWENSQALYGVRN